MQWLSLPSLEHRYHGYSTVTMATYCYHNYSVVSMVAVLLPCCVTLPSRDQICSQTWGQIGHRRRACTCGDEQGNALHTHYKLCLDIMLTNPWPYFLLLIIPHTLSLPITPFNPLPLLHPLTSMKCCTSCQFIPSPMAVISR